MPIDNVRYRLKAAKDPAPGVAVLRAKIGKDEVAGEYTVTGMIELTDHVWLLVTQMMVKKYRAPEGEPVDAQTGAEAGAGQGGVIRPSRAVTRP